LVHRLASQEQKPPSPLLIQDRDFYSLEPTFLARTALYCRERGLMKDMPALLCVVLATKDCALLERIFPRVLDNARMLRTFIQILRSGVVGRKSFGTAVKRMIRQWLEARNDERLFQDSIGDHPSLADVIKMVHPKPQTASRAAFYGYCLGKAYDATALPALVQQYEAYKAGDRAMVPDVPFQMLTALQLGTLEWTAIARRAPWQMTRMNLNTFARHGVFTQEGLPELIAARLREARAIAKARVFPYQLLAAYTNVDAAVPTVVREALQDAMEIAIANVPQLPGKVYVCPDVSGSMASPVTGMRSGSTSAMRCIDVAALVAAAVVRKNPQAEVLPFEHTVVSLNLNARDSVMTNAMKLASIGGGGTNCSAPLALLNKRKARGDLVIFVSDNESWMDAGRGRGTATMAEWQAFKQRNHAARLVCLDIQPYVTTQAKEREDVLNIGGFSAQVFEVVSEFATGRLHADHWVGVIEAVELEESRS
ncbi:MAG: TROVE domain-containing protein, partial [Candidatus Tectomicrobia bacterium]|nr:TROVE domain-containing protein [Candidatus Tectomicrobia bacterium]